MEKTKEKVVADLYSLRAGLSVISEKADEVRKLENNVKEIESEMENSNSLAQQMKDLAKKTKNQILTVNEKIKITDENINNSGRISRPADRLRNIAGNVSETMKNTDDTVELLRSVEVAEYSLNNSTIHVSRKHAHYSIKLLIGMFFVWWVVLMIAMTVCSTTGLINLERTPDIIIFVLLVVLSFIYVVIIFPIRSYKKQDKKYEKEYEADLQAAKAADNERKNKLINEELLPLQNTLKDIEQKISNQEQITADFEIQIEQLKQDTQVAVNEKAQESKIIESALAEHFNNLIIPSDWQNIDLIIFYLETGRADSMKEALQLADRQRQTDAIVREIRQANASICSEIKGGLKSLGVAMGQCFNLLSSQINEQHRQTMSALQFVADSNDKVVDAIGELKEQSKEQNAKLVSVTQLNNALQAKANLTSDRLKSDLEFMQYKMGMRN